MMKTLVVIFFLSSLLFGLGEQVDEFALLGRGAGVSGDFGIFSLWGNPAGIAKSSKMSALAGYQNLWGISEYSQYVVGGIYSMKALNCGFSVNYFGDPELYSELSFEAAVARELPDIWGAMPALGLRGRFINVGLPEPYTSTSVFLIDCGFQLYFGSRASLGLYAKNPLNTQLEGYDINRLLSFGIRYDPVSWSTVYADVQFPGNGPGELYLGQQLAINRWLRFNMGVGGRPTKFYLGADFAWQNLGISWGGAIHPEMGMSNGGKISWDKN